MDTINIHEAKTHLSRYLENVRAGDEVVIAKAGTPIARLVPIATGAGSRKLGRLKHKLRIPHDFDAPLPEDVIAVFEGR
jgi:prevent-host-death family protein